MFITMNKCKKGWRILTQCRLVLSMQKHASSFNAKTCIKDDNFDMASAYFNSSCEDDADIKLKVSDYFCFRGKTININNTHSQLMCNVKTKISHPCSLDE